METTILIQSAPKPNAINPPTQLWFTLNLIKIGLLASEIFFFEIVDGRRRRELTICIGENKDADQLAVIAKLISTFVFATRIVQFLFYLNPKFQASSSFLCLYRLVCVEPVRKPHCWFSHEVAHMLVNKSKVARARS